MSAPETGAAETTERCYRKGCRAPIRRLRNTSTGRLGPVDADPTPNGNIVIHLEAGTYTILGKSELEDARDEGVQLRLNHWMTCLDPPDKGAR